MKPLLVLIIAVLMNTSLSIADTLDARVSAVLRQTPLIDGHNDLPWQFKRRANNQLSAIDIGQNLSRSENPLHTDIPRLRAGMVGGLFWSVYVPIETYGGSAIAVQQVIDQIDLVYRLTERYSEDFEIALTASDVRRIHGEGKMASLIGMEGGHAIHNSLATLR